MTDIIIAVVIAVLGSSGLWAFIMSYAQKRSASTRLMLGIGHDRILYLGMIYIDKGEITQDEYENLHDYLYLPYKALGGNGTAEKIMEEVKRLKIVRTPFITSKKEK